MLRTLVSTATSAAHADCLKAAAADADCFPEDVILGATPDVILGVTPDAMKYLDAAEADVRVACSAKCSVADADVKTPRLNRMNQLVAVLSQTPVMADFCQAACFPADCFRDHVVEAAIPVVTLLHPIHVAVVMLDQRVDVAKNSASAVGAAGCFHDAETKVANPASAK